MSPGAGAPTPTRRHHLEPARLRCSWMVRSSRGCGSPFANVERTSTGWTPVRSEPPVGRATQSADWTTRVRLRIQPSGCGPSESSRARSSRRAPRGPRPSEPGAESRAMCPRRARPGRCSTATREEAALAGAATTLSRRRSATTSQAEHRRDRDDAEPARAAAARRAARAGVGVLTSWRMHTISSRCSAPALP